MRKLNLNAAIEKAKFNTRATYFKGLMLTGVASIIGGAVGFLAFGSLWAALVGGLALAVVIPSEEAALGYGVLGFFEGLVTPKEQEKSYSMEEVYKNPLKPIAEITEDSTTKGITHSAATISPDRSFARKLRISDSNNHRLSV